MIQGLEAAIKIAEELPTLVATDVTGKIIKEESAVTWKRDLIYHLRELIKETRLHSSTG